MNVVNPDEDWEIYHCLSQIFQHETQCRRRVGHRVRAMKDYETVEGRIVQLYVRCNPDPVYTDA